MRSTPPAAQARLAPMRRTDLPEVVAIEASVSSRPWSDATFRTELARDDRRYLVARSTGAGSGGADLDIDPVRRAGRARVSGFAGVALFPDEAHVMTIAVEPGRRGRGIGGCLVAGMLDEVAGAGLSAVTLEVRASNGSARRLYRRAGFAEAGVRPRYYPDGEDALIMWLRRDVEVS